MNKKILIVVSTYYKEISNFLLQGSTNFLTKNNQVSYEIIEAPGCFEIPFLINKNIESYDGFIALGCVLRGQTYHFELISNECSRKIMDLTISSKKPIGFGILTCENIEQALARSDPNKLNKGREAAFACLNLLFK